MSKGRNPEFVKYSDKYANEPDIPFYRETEANRATLCIGDDVCGRIRLNYLPAVDDPDENTIETAEITHHTYEIEYWTYNQKTGSPKISAVFDSFVEMEEFIVAMIKAGANVRSRYHSVMDRSGNDGEPTK